LLSKPDAVRWQAERAYSRRLPRGRDGVQTVVGEMLRACSTDVAGCSHA